MNISNKCLSLIKKFEGFSSKPYLCPANVPTIGYGTTYYENKIRVTLEDEVITEEKATQLLYHIIKKFEKGVNELIKSTINQNQFDALVSFTYNLGLTNLKNSTLLKKVNVNPVDKSIFDQFLRWNKANGKELAGLTARRLEEATLYFKPIV